MEAAFAEPSSEAERQIKALIERFASEQETRYQQELFKQRARLVDAERKLATRPSKAAAESRRIAGEKIDWLVGKLADLHRSEPKDDDSRIFPGHYAPVMVMENGRRVIKPMRYQCRPAGKPASHDIKFPGTYNASAALLTVRSKETAWNP
jgi:hypothetical protein